MPEKRILLILPDLPWPIRDSGVGMRFAPIIEYLSSRHAVDLLVIANHPVKWPNDSIAHDPRCRIWVYVAPKLQLRRLVRLLRAAVVGMLPWGVPLEYLADRNSRQVVDWLRTRISGIAYSTVVIGGGQLDIAARLREIAPDCRLVMDFVDSPTLTVRRKAATRGWHRIVDAYMSWKCARLERRVGRAFDASIYISSIDAGTVNDVGSQSINVVPNGVYEEDATLVTARVARKGNVIGFLGNMGYGPNIEAAIRLATKILPIVTLSRPGTRLKIIGRGPSPEIWALAGPDVEVTGTVDDIWPHISATDVFVFPMLSGAGLQNKILDAMRGGIPVVTSPLAGASLSATAGKDYLLADSDEEFAREAVRLLEDDDLRDRIAAEATRLLREKFSWAALLPQYEAVLLGTPP